MKGNWTTTLYTNWEKLGSQRDCVVNFKLTFQINVTILNQGERRMWWTQSTMYCIHENKQHSFFPGSKNNLCGFNNQAPGFVKMWLRAFSLILLSYFSWKSAFVEDSKLVKCRHTCMFWNLGMGMPRTGLDRKLGTNKNCFVKGQSQFNDPLKTHLAS